MRTGADFVGELRRRLKTPERSRKIIFVERKGRSVSEHSIGFDELDARARAIGARLAGDPAAESPVLLTYSTGLEFLCTFLGCLYSGTVAVPTPLPTASKTASALVRGVLKDTNARLVLTETVSRSTVSTWLDDTGLGDTARCVATESIDADDQDTWSVPSVDQNAPAYLQYTSGSTSQPKGVVLSRANLAHNAHEISMLIGQPDTGTTVTWLPHYHDMGLVGQFLQPLFMGMNIVFTSPTSFLMRPALWLELISRYKASHTAAPDFGYNWCTQRVTDDQLAGVDLSSLRVAMNGAEPIRHSTLRRFEERFTPSGFQPDAWMPVYGMAEATLLVVGSPLRSGATTSRFHTAELERHRARPVNGPGTELVASGRPQTLTVAVVDPESHEEVAEGEIGEIWVRGQSVAQGYWQRPSETSDTFSAYTAGGVGPFLRTGDLGFFREGSLYVTGRSKDVVIINGRTLYPQDIELVSQGVSGALGASAAFAVDTGNEQVVVVQEVRRRNSTAVSLGELARQVGDAVMEYFQLRSVSVVLVRQGGVEKTTSGKVRRGYTRYQLFSGELAALHTELDPQVRRVVDERAIDWSDP